VSDALLRNGAEVFNKDHKGQTPLHCAARFQNICLLIMMQKPDCVNLGDDNGDTPLMNAVGGDKAISVLRAMIEMGASPNAVNKKGQTALHHLAMIEPQQSSAAIASILLDAGIMPSAQDSDGNTAVHYASGVAGSHPNEELAICLVLKGTSLNIPNQDGYTPLDGLLDNPPPHVAQQLLRLRTRMLESVISPPEWAADHMANNCQMCRKQFGRLQFTRKHHCRMCGRIVCSTCSDQKRSIPKLGVDEQVRLCNVCTEVVDSG